MGQRTQQIVKRMAEEGRKSLAFFRDLKAADWSAQAGPGAPGAGPRLSVAADVRRRTISPAGRPAPS